MLEGGRSVKDEVAFILKVPEASNSVDCGTNH